jgi:hypothetical protein
MKNIYRHYKGGIYKVLLWATDTETGETSVVYEGTDGKIWVRPATMFFENVEVNGVKEPRFNVVGTFKM